MLSQDRREPGLVTADWTERTYLYYRSCLLTPLPVEAPLTAVPLPVDPRVRRLIRREESREDDDDDDDDDVCKSTFSRLLLLLVALRLNPTFLLATSPVAAAGTPSAPSATVRRVRRCSRSVAAETILDDGMCAASGCDATLDAAEESEARRTLRSLSWRSTVKSAEEASPRITAPNRDGKACMTSSRK